MAELTREQILAAPAKLVETDVPEWGGSVWIRPMTLAEHAKMADLYIRFEKASTVDKAKRVVWPLIVAIVSNSKGEPIFTPEDYEEVSAKPASAGAILRLQEEIRQLSGLTKESREALEKNSPTALTAGPVSQ